MDNNTLNVCIKSEPITGFVYVLLPEVFKTGSPELDYDAILSILNEEQFKIAVDTIINMNPEIQGFINQNQNQNNELIIDLIIAMQKTVASIAIYEQIKNKSDISTGLLEYIKTNYIQKINITSIEENVKSKITNGLLKDNFMNFLNEKNKENINDLINIIGDTTITKFSLLGGTKQYKKQCKSKKMKKKANRKSKKYSK
jgi:hypothetical protein